MPDVERFELSRILGTPESDDPPSYRIAEMWWKDVETLRAALVSEDGRAVLADMENFVTGGATLLISEQDEP